MFEPHASGHAHMRYSTALAWALASAAGDSYELELLIGAGNTAVSVEGVAVRPVIQVPRVLADYRSRMFGILDRCLHWGRADRQIVSWVHRHPVAMVHYQDLYGISTLMGVRALRRLGARTILTVHNVEPHRTPPWQPAFARKWIERAVFRNFDALIVHSEQLELTLRRALKRSSPPIYVAQHGIGETLRPGPLPPLEARLARKALLFVGAPRPNKGLSLLVDAMRTLPDFSLTIAGFDAAALGRRDTVQRAISDARRQGARITVLRGFVPDPDLDQLFRTHSAVVLPYRPDFKAQSGVLSQAISYRLPVVVTDVGALGETVRKLGIGTVAPPGSAAEFAEGVRRLYSLMPETLAAALSSAASSLAWSSVARATLEIYDDVRR